MEFNDIAIFANVSAGHMQDTLRLQFATRCIAMSISVPMHLLQAQCSHGIRSVSLSLFQHKNNVQQQHRLAEPMRKK